MSVKILCPQEIHELKEAGELFDRIPADQWCKYNPHDDRDRHCARGWLQVHWGRVVGWNKAVRLGVILGRSIASINDAGATGHEAAKENVLRAIRNAIERGMVEQ